MARRQRTFEERFWKQFEMGKLDECWEWQGGKQGDGYGILRLSGRSVLAHRISYELMVGPIPPGLHVLHSCDNPPCINPHHLHIGTDLDNARESKERGRRGRLCGEKNGRAKLSPSDVRLIRALYNAGELSWMSLSRRFGVSSQQIGRIVKWKQWVKTSSK